MQFRSHIFTLRFATLLLFSVWWFAARAEAQIRVFDYNTAAASRPGMSTILSAVGAEVVNGIARPPDVLTLQEQESAATTTQAIVDVLNSIYGSGTYTQATLDGGSTGGGHPGMIYNTHTITLIAQTTASTTSTTGAARQTLRYELQPVGYDSSANFFVYDSHYKASSGTSNAQRRDVEAQEVRANADALGNAHIIYTGDFNVYTSSEPMFQTLLAAGNGQAFDPANRVGAWSNNASFLDVHTQSPAATSRYGGQVTGGVDDRFDFQLVSGEFLDGAGLSYIGGSYHPFGNTGTHTLNGDITTGSVSALQARLPGYTAEQTSAVLDALASTSDHLPVVADYQVPARLGVQVATVPARVIRDASVSIAVTVANTANVVAANGADKLNYTLSASGNLSGSATGETAALSSGNLHSVALQTSQVGAKTGRVEVHTSSQGAANKDFGLDTTYTVLDHARPFFADQPGALVLTIDFGVVNLNATAADYRTSIGNWTSDLGATAGLDLDQIALSGDSPAFHLDLTPFSNLASGTGRTFLSSFAPSHTGSFSAQYDLFFSDENIPGATDLRTLRLQLVGTAVPEPSATWLLAAALLGYLTRRPGRIAGTPARQR